jgi:hypothetical protein
LLLELPTWLSQNILAPPGLVDEEPENKKTALAAGNLPLNSQVKMMGQGLWDRLWVANWILEPTTWLSQNILGPPRLVMEVPENKKTALVAGILPPNSQVEKKGQELNH